MLLIENAAALIAFVFLFTCFALGYVLHYVLRERTDATRTDRQEGREKNGRR